MFYGLDSLKPNAWTEDKSSPRKLSGQSIQLETTLTLGKERTAVLQSTDLASNEPLGLRDNMYR